MEMGEFFLKDWIKTMEFDKYRRMKIMLQLPIGLTRGAIIGILFFILLSVLIPQTLLCKDIIFLTPDQAKTNITPFVSVLKDPRGQWNISDVISPDLESAFKPNSENLIFLTGQPGAVWVRLSLAARQPFSSTSLLRILDIRNAIVDFMEFYVPDPGKPGNFMLIGTLESGENIGNIGSLRNPYFTLGVSDQPTCFYLRLSSYGPTVVPLSLHSLDSFLKSIMYDNLSFGLVYGIMLCMIIYNLFIFFSLKKSIYLAYVLNISSFLVYYGLFNGHIPALIGLDKTTSQSLEWIVLGIAMFFSIQFCSQFFDIKIYLPRWIKVLHFFRMIALCLILSGLFQFHDLAANLGNFVGMIGPINFLIIGWLRWRQGFATAKYYMLAIFYFILGTWIYVFWTMGLLHSDIPSDLLFTQGPAIEALLLSFALAARIKALEKETIVLTKSQILYKEASETDGLTGLYNKRYLLEHLDACVAEADKNNSHLSFIIMDVDNFKQFNDTHGHPEGDKVLKALAKVIIAGIREKDCGCRYGGEEFSIILPGISVQDARGVADRIRQNFADLVFTPPGGPTASVSISMGGAQHCQGHSPESLVQKADTALYTAKQQGKNRVFFDCQQTKSLG